MVKTFSFCLQAWASKSSSTNGSNGLKEADTNAADTTTTSSSTNGAKKRTNADANDDDSSNQESSEPAAKKAIKSKLAFFVAP